MKKSVKTWSVDALQEYFTRINFPEYQREPNVWSRAAKQRLVDSMLRQFDVSPLYFYNNMDGTYDCVDGRQRIGAIMSFLGENGLDEDNGFEFRISNEVYDDIDHRFRSLDKCSLAEVKGAAKAKDLVAKELVTSFRSYELTVIELSESRQPEEFNLQFTRLNLGVIINSGEKLHAMVGELRDVCFGSQGLGQHRFLEEVRIPTRRFSREQTATQIVAQIFSLELEKQYARTRHFDLQKLFKENLILSPNKRGYVQKLRQTLDALAGAFRDPAMLGNRAITISTVLLAWELGVRRKNASELASFIEEFTCRLKWQIQKGLDVDLEYRYLSDFQRHITQASVERPAVQSRANTFRELYKQWGASGKIAGDTEYRKRTGLDPKEQCRT